jgi:hypothetical protein
MLPNGVPVSVDLHTARKTSVGILLQTLFYRQPAVATHRGADVTDSYYNGRQISNEGRRRIPRHGGSDTWPTRPVSASPVAGEASTYHTQNTLTVK